MFTEFTVSMMYLLYIQFEAVSIVKPVQSRPANSERYIVCTGFVGRTPALVEYLLSVQARLREIPRPSHLPQDATVKDIACVVPMERLYKVLYLVFMAGKEIRL